MYGIDIECNHYPGQRTTWNLKNISFKTLEEHIKKIQKCQDRVWMGKTGDDQTTFLADVRNFSLVSCILYLLLF